SADEPRKIVASDVLDHAAASFRDSSIGERDLDANDQVSRGPVFVPARTAVVGRHDSADSGALPVTRVQRQPLTGTRKDTVRGGERFASRDRRHEIAGEVLNGCVETSRR